MNQNPYRRALAQIEDARAPDPVKPVMIYITAEQRAWLDTKAKSLGMRRAEFVRKSISALMQIDAEN